MSARSSIEWTDATWNPVTGCDKVSPGCAHCYAETFAERWRGTPGHPFEQGFDLRLWPERLELPLRWRKPRMVFVNSMSDLFHEDVPDEFIGRVLNTICFAGYHHGHVFQVLTKRPERMLDCMRRYYSEGGLDGTGNPSLRSSGVGVRDGGFYVIPWLWLGVSIENRRFVGRADVLRETPAAVRFISAEPLLGPLVPGVYSLVNHERDWQMPPDYEWQGRWADSYEGPGLELEGIDWLIAGGESGPKHRPVREEWVLGLRDACLETGQACARCHGYGWEEAEPDPSIADENCERCCGTGREPWTGTAFFFKQWGGARPKSNGRELDGRTWDEMPATTPERAA